MVLARKKHMFQREGPRNYKIELESDTQCTRSAVGSHFNNFMRMHTVCHMTCMLGIENPLTRSRDSLTTAIRLVLVIVVENPEFVFTDYLETLD